MTKKYPNLFSPIKIRGVTLKNRIVGAPMLGEGIFKDGVPTDKAAAFYGRRAQGGAAVVTVGESQVNYGNAVSKVLTLSLRDITMKDDSFRRVTYGIKRHGALASIEISHAGQAARESSLGDETEDNRDFVPIGPSEYIRRDGVRVREMTHEKIKEVIEDFAVCAYNAKFSGFNMIQLHGGHGWLLSQFSSPLTNRRTDEYGGSAYNRSRFARELLDAIRARVGEDFLIEYRISGDEMVEGGMKIEDTVEFVKYIEDKVDIIHISVGTIWNIQSDNYMFPLWYVPHGCNVEMAAKVKAAVSKCAVAVVGGISDPAMAEDIIASGKADLVAINRGLLADPDWCVKALEGRSDEIIPCVRCIACHDLLGRDGAFCAVNPASLQELWLANAEKPAASRKVVVVGGGVGGMQAAITAAMRGHRVVLFEKSDRLGGIMKLTDASPVKTDLKNFKNYQINMLAKLGVDVRLNTEAALELVEAEEPYAVIAAVGSEPITPDIPGIDEITVISATEAYEKFDGIGKTVVIIGGNLTGVELGIDLAAAGRGVTVIEMTDAIAAGAPMFYRAGIEEELSMYSDRLTCLTGHKCTSIFDDLVLVNDAEGLEKRLPADTVIYAVGMKAKEDEAESFRGSALYFRKIGDCDRVKKLKHAVEGGFLAALEIL